MTVDYITSADVLALTATRLANQFALLDPVAQATEIAAVTEEINELTGQDGGCLLQTGKTYTVFWDALANGQYGDVVWLPNRPIISVTALVVTPGFDGAPSPNQGTPLVYSCDSASIILGGNRFRWVGKWDHISPQTERSPRRPFQDGDTIAVTYSCGVGTGPPSVPAGLKRAAYTLLAQKLFALLDNPGGIESQRAGSDQQRWSPQTNVAGGNIMELLSPYMVRRF